MFFLNQFGHKQICKHYTHQAQNGSVAEYLKILLLQNEETLDTTLRGHEEKIGKEVRSLTLGGRRTKNLVESEQLLPLIIFGGCDYWDSLIIKSFCNAQTSWLSRQKGSYSTIHPYISCQNPNNNTLFHQYTNRSKFMYDSSNVQIIRNLPLRSCTWLYSLRFSSRTFWYREATLAREFKCLPIIK